MKKLLALFLSLAAVMVCFAGCGTNENTDSKAADKGFTTVKEGVLTMATSAAFPPYEYHEGDEIVGIDAEIAGLIAKKLDLKLEIQDVEFGSIIPGIQSGKYDIGMAGMTVTPDRKKKVNFSDSYANGVQSIVVREGSDIKTKDDLKKAKKIGVQQDTTGDIYVTGEFGEDKVVRYLNSGLAIEGLKKSKVDCVIIDNQPAKSHVAASTGLKILDTEYTNEDYAAAFSKKNPELYEKANAALKELIADGSVQKVIDKYIKAD